VQGVLVIRFVDDQQGLQGCGTHQTAKGPDIQHAADGVGRIAENDHLRRGLLAECRAPGIDVEFQR